MSLKQNISLLTFIMAIVCHSAYAQKPKVENLPKFEEKLFHFGFSLGINTGSFALERKAINTNYDSLYTIDVDPQSGFNLHIVSALHLNKYFSLRFLPGLTFTQRNLIYKFEPQAGQITTYTQVIESTYLDFPLLMKYRSARLNNFAAYVIGGACYSIDFASNEDVNNSLLQGEIVKIRKNTTSAQIGVGTDFFLPYFKFALEAKMVYGLQDVLIRDNTRFSNPIDRLYPKMFVFSLLFEG